MAAVPDYVHDATGRILGAVLPCLRRTPGPVADGEVYARYRYTLSRLIADPRSAARSETLAVDLAAVVDGYRLAASDMRRVIDGLDRVIIAARAVQPVTGGGSGRRQQAVNEIMLALLVECLAIAAQGAALAALQPRSHDEARRYRRQFGRSIDLAIERAADQDAIATVRALRELQGRIARDMIERGRPLARIVSYETAVPLPAVTLAHLLYQDGRRHAELADENADHDHPAFMPTEGRAYSR